MIPECNTLEVIDLLFTHHEFMQSLRKVAVFCNNNGKEAAALADYHWDNESKKAVGDLEVHVFTNNPIPNANKRKNIKIHNGSFRDTGFSANSFDFVLAVDVLRYQHDPFAAFKHWNSILKTDGMLCLNFPQTSYIDDLSRWQVTSYSQSYYSWNLLNLIHSLAVSGFDCRDGHFKQTRHNPWVWAAVYKNNTKPLDPETTNWYELKEKNLTPASLDQCIEKHGYTSNRYLKVEWLDHSVYDIELESLP